MSQAASIETSSETVTSLLRKKNEGEKEGEKDAFGRETLIQNIIRLIENTHQSFVISVEGEFGSGKSFVLNKLVNKLQKGSKALYLNVWEVDYVNDPIIALIAKMEEAGWLKSAAGKDIKQAAISLGKNILINGVEKGTLGVVGVKEAVKDAETVYSKRYDAFKDSQKCLQNLQQKLKKLASEEGKNRPLVIVIDELDRCRPTYAVEVLEALKHIFNVDNIVFVLGIDRKQLISSAKSIYGNEMDGDGYLRKFIDWPCRLPEQGKEDYISHLWGEFGLSEVIPDGIDFKSQRCNFFWNVNVYSQLFDLSLRDIAQYMTSFNVIVRMNAHKNYLFPSMLMFLLILRDKNPDLYKNYCLKGGATHIAALFDNLQQRDDRKIHFEEQKEMSFDDDKMVYLIGNIDGFGRNYSAAAAGDHRLNEQQKKNSDACREILNQICKISERGAHYLYQMIENVMDIEVR